MMCAWRTRGGPVDERVDHLVYCHQADAAAAHAAAAHAAVAHAATATYAAAARPAASSATTSASVAAATNPAAVSTSLAAAPPCPVDVTLERQGHRQGIEPQRLTSSSRGRE